MIVAVPTHYSASRTIDASLNRIFGLLATPSTHHLFDGSGMVGAPETTDRLSRVGQAFVMNMTDRSGDRLERYQSDNYVNRLEEPR